MCQNMDNYRLVALFLVIVKSGSFNATPLDEVTINLNLQNTPEDEEILGDETFDEDLEVKADQTNDVTVIVIGGYGKANISPYPIQTLRNVITFRNGRWGRDRILPERRKGMGAANLNGLIYVAGGIGEHDNTLDTVLKRTRGGESWETHSVLGQKRAYATLNTVTQQGEDTLMVTGGLNQNNQALASTEIHLPEVGWLTAPPMGDTRYGHAAAVLEGKLFVLGGSGSCRFTESCTEFFDFTFQVWTRGPRMTEKRTFPAAAVLLNGNNPLIYICGGFRGPEHSREFLKSCEKGDEYGFSRIGDMNHPRAQFGLLNIGTGLWAIGGANTNGELKSVEKYADETWTNEPRSSMRNVRKLFGAATISNVPK